MKVCSMREMRAVEHRACTEVGLTQASLLENAGHAVYQLLRSNEELKRRRYIVLCGTTSKGCVGLVLARLLHAAGIEIRVFFAPDPLPSLVAYATNLQVAKACGVTLQSIEDLEGLQDALIPDAVVVDALIDSLPDPPTPFEPVIDRVIRSEKSVVAIDVPSGVHPDTGGVGNFAIRAKATVSLGLPRRGCLLAPGRSHAGRLFVSHLSFPPWLLNDDELSVELARPLPLKPRDPHGHKGTFGDALFVAGAYSYYGAPALAAMASLRAGGGYARLACPKSIIPTIASFAPEVVFVPQSETKEGSIAHENLNEILALANQVDFVVLGPGLSLHAETQQLVRDLAQRIAKPLLIDGDGLSAIAKHSEVLRNRKAPTVLTPHPGELARILDVATGQVVADPIESALRASRLTNAIVVAKGSPTLVARTDGRVSINTSGNDGMGTAGSGDVLTGTITAMNGLGLSFEDAVLVGVFLHGLAGDRARDALGADGMTARDILGHLPEAVREYRQRHSEISANFYDACEVL